MKQFLVTLVLALAVAGMALPQTVGVGVGPTFTQMNAGPQPYDSADGLWKFDNSAALGEDSIGSADLTPVGSPTWGGGANGYSLELLRATNNYADDDGDDFNFGATETDFAFAGWYYPTDCALQHCGLAGYAQPASNAISWQIYHQSGVMYFQTSTDGQISGRTILTCKTGLSDNTPIYFEGSYDFTADEMKCRANQEAEQSVSAGHPFDTSTPEFTVGGYANDGTFTGSIGTVAVWTGTTTIPTDMWNGGIGNDCAGVTSTNGFACYDWDTDGGPYTDKWGDHDLVGVNTPTRNRGVTNREDSGLSVTLDGTTQRLDIARSVSGVLEPWSGVAQEDVTWSAWAFHNEGAAGNDTIIGCTNSVLSIRAYSDGDMDFIIKDPSSNLQRIQTHGKEFTLNEWHLVVAVYEASTTNDVVLWLDGVEIGRNDDGYSPGTYCQNAVPAASLSHVGADWGVNLWDGSIDMVAVWRGQAFGAGKVGQLWAGGAGVFYAATLDFIFHGPHFAWSKPPELRRVS
jgi:hypothetical protein